MTHDTYDGFHIGVPDGWSMFTINGTVVVSKDAAGTEEAVVDPAEMSSGDTATSRMAAALEALKTKLAAYGVTLTYTAAEGAPDHPIANLSLQGAQATAVGQARLTVLPDATAHGSAQAVLVAGWAPAAQYATDSALLSSVGDCYGPEPATLYKVMHDQVFTYAIPPGWTVQNEGQDTIEIAQGNDASASYLLTLVPQSAGVNSPQSLLTYALNQLGVTVGQVLATTQLPSTRTSTGATQGQEYEAFIGTLKDGRAVHGLVYVLSVTSSGNPTTGVIRIALASTALWNSLNGALVHIAGTIQHNFTQDLQQWEHVSQQWQAFDQQVQGFDDALRGVDLVHDAATGETFEAPYQAYNNSGPAGPGYYDTADRKLQIITPS